MVECSACDITLSFLDHCRRATLRDCRDAGWAEAQSSAKSARWRGFAPFSDRIFSFELAVATAYGDLVAETRREGRSVGMADGYIAGTARSHKLKVAIRDTGPFETVKLKVINPWQEHPSIL